MLGLTRENVGNSDGRPPTDDVEVAAYVGSLSRDLSAMSRRSGLTTLAYLLEMASLEADIVARGPAKGGAFGPSGPRLDGP